MASADKSWSGVAAIVENASELGIAEDVAQKMFDALTKSVLTQKTPSLQKIRRFVELLGANAASSLDSLKDKEAAGLVAKLDKANSARAKDDLAWGRRRLHDLAFARAEPDPIVAKAKPPPRPSNEKRPAVVRTSQKGTALSAKRKKASEES